MNRGYYRFSDFVTYKQDNFKLIIQIQEISTVRTFVSYVSVHITLLAGATSLNLIFGFKFFV